MDIHLHLDNLTINVVHTVKVDDAIMTLFRSIKKDIATMSTTVQEALDTLTAEVAQEETVIDSASALIDGFAGQLAAAVAAAQAAGATQAQLAAFDALGTTLTAGKEKLAAAVAAGTPAAPPASPPAT